MKQPLWWHATTLVALVRLLVASVVTIAEVAVSGVPASAQSRNVSVAPPTPEKRVALVMGNDAYQHVRPLPVQRPYDVPAVRPAGQPKRQHRVPLREGRPSAEVAPLAWPMDASGHHSREIASQVARCDEVADQRRDRGTLGVSFDRSTTETERSTGTRRSSGS